MTDKQTGGPAFPVQSIYIEDQETNSKGMTLRDYFAAQALAGNLEQGIQDDMTIDWWHEPSKIAKRAYAIADAMLKAREQ